MIDDLGSVPVSPEASEAEAPFTIVGGAVANAPSRPAETFT
jgi:hypothetical protein